MTNINYKSLFMGIAHGLIIPLTIALLSKNILLGFAYYAIPLVAYESFAAHKEEGRVMFYSFSIFMSIVFLLALGGL